MRVNCKLTNLSMVLCVTLVVVVNVVIVQGSQDYSLTLDLAK